MQLTLGPVPYRWSSEMLHTFYSQVAESSIDEVYLGETICLKRAVLKESDYIGIGTMLEGVGKQVLLSSLVLVKNDEELLLSRQLFDFGYSIEANNTALLNMADGRTNGMVLGSTIPIYNRQSAELFIDIAKRVVLSAEFPKETLFEIAHGLPMETEICFYGRTQLGHSWSCYTARHRGLVNSNCGIVCKEYGDGINATAISGEKLWNINGTGVQSQKKVCLLSEIEEIEKTGVTHLRITPQLTETFTVVSLIREVMDGDISIGRAMDEIKKIDKENLCNGWFYGKPGLEFIEG